MDAPTDALMDALMDAEGQVVPVTMSNIYKGGGLDYIPYIFHSICRVSKKYLF